MNYKINNRKRRENKKVDIVNLISQRLNLQSTQHNLEQEFNIHIPSITFLSNIISKYDEWPEEKRSKFTKLIGGYFHKQAKDYLVELKNKRIQDLCRTK